MCQDIELMLDFLLDCHTQFVTRYLDRSINLCAASDDRNCAVLRECPSS
jgi:hypothetical protein